MKFNLKISFILKVLTGWHSSLIHKAERERAREEGVREREIERGRERDSTTSGNRKKDRFSAGLTWVDTGREKMENIPAHRVNSHGEHSSYVDVLTKREL